MNKIVQLVMHHVVNCGPEYNGKKLLLRIGINVRRGLNNIVGNIIKGGMKSLVIELNSKLTELRILIVVLRYRSISSLFFIIPQFKLLSVHMGLHIQNISEWTLASN